MYSKEFRLLVIALCFNFTVRAADDSPASPTPSRQLSASFVNSMAVLENEHPLGPGDQLSFRVIEDEDPPKLVTITASGEVEIPYIGRIQAAGKTCRTLAYELKSALEKEYYIKATVILGLDVIGTKGSVSKGKVYLTGQVRTQGPLDIPSDETFTLSKAILKAGGFAEYANKRKVRVTRKQKNGATETKTVDLVEVIEKGKSGGDITLEPDDVIFVPERLINF
jgi:protein involved in polysaccharide export with SLBB domain